MRCSIYSGTRLRCGLGVVGCDQKDTCAVMLRKMLGRLHVVALGTACAVGMGEEWKKRNARVEDNWYGSDTADGPI